MLKTAIIIAATLVATAANAQSRFDDMVALDAGRYGPRPPAIDQSVPYNRSRVLACVVANDAVGVAIHNASWRVTKLEQSRGGYLSFDEAEHIRNVIYNETFPTRQILRRIIASGDVSQCNALRDEAVGIIRDITEPLG